MRGIGGLTLLAALAAAGPARAQERPEPRLILSLSAGLGSARTLWELNRQPLIVRGTEAGPLFDTLLIARRINTGLVLAGTGTLFRSPNLGLSAELLFLSLGTRDRCELVFEHVGLDPLQRNAQMCRNVGTGAASTVTLSLGATYRFAPRGFASPYLRLQAGLSTRTPTTVELLGRYREFDGRARLFTIIQDPGRSNTAPTAGGAAGVMLPIGPGYQVRLELRDQTIFLDRVTGPAVTGAEGPFAPTERILVHTFALVFGLDVVLEQKRGRRY